MGRCISRLLGRTLLEASLDATLRAIEQGVARYKCSFFVSSPAINFQQTAIATRAPIGFVYGGAVFVEYRVENGSFHMDNSIFEQNIAYVSRDVQLVFVLY